MNKLTAAQSSSNEHLARVVSAALDMSAHNVNLRRRPPTQHQSNRLYDALVGCRHIIVKEYQRREEFETAPMREYAALRLLSSLDIAPRPVGLIQPGDSHGPMVIYQFLEGRSWDRDSPSPQDLSSLAGAWLRVNDLSSEDLWYSRAHRHSPDSLAVLIREQFRRHRRYAKAEYHDGIEAAEECLRLLELRLTAFDQLARAKAPLRFCRSDARFSDFIRRPDGRLGMVDWEDSGLLDPAQDVADLLTHANQEDLLTWLEWDSFLKPYVSAREFVDPDFRERLRLHLAIMPLLWLSILLRHGLNLLDNGQLDGWSINELPANRHLRRYLARALAWPSTDFTEMLDSLGNLRFWPLL